MQSLPLALHLASTLSALVFGLFIVFRRKGDVPHRAYGRIWVVLMSIAAISSFWLTGMRNGFSLTHLLSVWTLVAMALAIWFVRKGKLVHHKRLMVGTYLGLVGAGVGAFAPGRLMSRSLLSLVA